MLTGDIEGRFLEFLVFLAQPRLVLEIGTYSGYSALSMAGALPPGGRIVTCELLDEHADVAERHIAAAGMADRIEVRRGPAQRDDRRARRPVRPRLHRRRQGGLPRLLRGGAAEAVRRGLIVVDNVAVERPRAAPPAADDEESTVALRAFNDHVAADERVVSVMLTVRDGVMLVRRA